MQPFQRAGRQWEQAVALLHKMRKAGIIANVINFITAVSACEKGAQWERALALLHKMRHSGMTANMMIFSAADSAR